jgi:hypothetical protein
MMHGQTNTKFIRHLPSARSADHFDQKWAWVLPGEFVGQEYNAASETVT